MDWKAISDWFVTFGKNAGIKILEVIAIFIGGIIVIKLTRKILLKILSKTKMNKVTYKFFIKLVSFALYLLLLILLCQFVGIPMTGLIALLSACGLAISLSLQSSLSNLANGIILIGTKPFNEGDYISVNGKEGTVKSINIMHTLITTRDNKDINIPNSVVLGNEIINFNAHQTRRVQISYQVAYETDVKQAKDVIMNVMRNNNKVLLEPEPYVALELLGESYIQIFTYCWCYTNDYWDVLYDLTEVTFNELKRNKISIPYQQMEVRLRQDKVVMPYPKEKLALRDETIAVKPPKEKEDIIISMVKKLTKHEKKEQNLKIANQAKLEISSKENMKPIIVSKIKKTNIVKIDTKKDKQTTSKTIKNPVAKQTKTQVENTAKNNKPTTKVTTKATTKVTTKVTAKATAKPTAKPTAKVTKNTKNK